MTETETRNREKCRLAEVVLRTEGKLRLRVTGTSMLPTLWPGELVKVDRAEVAEVAPGEVVIYSRRDRLVIHRALGRTWHNGKLALLTRGDAIPVADEPVREEELLGRVTAGDGEKVRSLSAVRRACGLLLNFSERLRGAVLHMREWRGKGEETAGSAGERAKFAEE